MDPFFSLENKGPSLYYVRVFWGFLQPPNTHPLCKDIFIKYIRLGKTYQILKSYDFLYAFPKNCITAMTSAKLFGK